MTAPRAPAPTAGPAPDAALTYRAVGLRSLRLFAFLPAGHATTDHRPAVPVIHGGG